MSVLQLVSVIVLVIVAAALLPAGVRGMRGSLRRGGAFGVRTKEAQRSEEAFQLANRIAALPWTVGGAIALAGAIICVAVPTSGAVLIVLIVAVVGALLIAAAGGVLGHRAAAALPEPAPAGGCGGCACGGGGCAALTKN